MAQALVLCADADVIKKRDGESELPLVSLIAPVITVINSMNTRAYMSSRKADTAIFLLLMMAQDADFNSISGISISCFLLVFCKFNLYSCIINMFTILFNFFLLSCI